jgi:hypothetical protein
MSITTQAKDRTELNAMVEAFKARGGVIVRKERKVKAAVKVKKIQHGYKKD